MDRRDQPRFINLNRCWVAQPKHKWLRIELLFHAGILMSAWGEFSQLQRKLERKLNLPVSAIGSQNFPRHKQFWG
jgi:hypothetical protein